MGIVHAHFNMQFNCEEKGVRIEQLSSNRLYVNVEIKTNKNIGFINLYSLRVASCRV